MNYNIYSGFVKVTDQNILDSKYGGISTAEFFEQWYVNTIKYYPFSQIYLFGPDKINWVGNQLTQLAQYDNLGHVGDYITGTRQGLWCGWTAGIVFGMLHAYLCNKDFVYKEQDCLVFGKCIEKMYDEIGNCGLIYGKNKIQASSQSLFLVKRDTIPELISFLSQKSDSEMIPEMKFSQFPNSTFFSFGYDRDRPFNLTDDVFYVQQITKKEYQLMKDSNILC